MFVQVQRVRRLNERVHEFELISADGRELPPYKAGAHIELEVPGFGPRHYSLVRTWKAGDPYVIAVQRDDDGRGGSAWLHQHLEVGSMLDIKGPRNQFALLGDTARTVLIAGGIGITPILSMAEQLRQQSRPFDLIVCARDPLRLA